MRTFCLLALLGTGPVLAQPTPGDPAPDPGVDVFLNAPVTASWAALDGHARVVDLWATWCAPCVATIPHLNALADTFAGRPVQFVSITDEPVEVVEPFLRDLPIRGWVGLDEDGSATRIYGVYGIPAVLLIYPDGRLGALTDPDEVTASVVEALLAGDSLEVRQRSAGTTPWDAALRARAAGPPGFVGGPPVFEAAWGPEGLISGTRGNAEDGWMVADGQPLASLLAGARGTLHPYQEDPTSPSLRRARIDVPEALRSRPVTLTMYEPGLEREQYAAVLFDRLGAALDLDLGVEMRPETTYVLRRHPDRLLSLDADGGRMSTSSRRNVFAANGATPFVIARALSGAIGHVVTDDSGLDGTYRLLLRLPAETVDFEAGPLGSEAVDAVRTALLDATGLDLVPEVRPVEWIVVRPVTEAD